MSEKFCCDVFSALVGEESGKIRQVVKDNEDLPENMPNCDYPNGLRNWDKFEEYRKSLIGKYCLEFAEPTYYGELEYTRYVITHCPFCGKSL